MKTYFGRFSGNTLILKNKVLSCTAYGKDKQFIEDEEGFFQLDELECGTLVVKEYVLTKSLTIIERELLSQLVDRQDQLE